MASKRFERNSEEFYFFGDYWNLAQKYFIPEDGEEYWQDLIDDCSKLADKYKGTFYQQMIVGLQLALETVYKEERGE